MVRSLVVKLRDLHEVTSSFASSISGKRTQPISIEELSTVIKKGWFVERKVRVTSFVTKLLIL